MEGRPRREGGGRGIVLPLIKVFAKAISNGNCGPPIAEHLKRNHDFVLAATIPH